MPTQATPAIGDTVVILDDHDPALPTGDYIGCTGRLLRDYSAGAWPDEVRYVIEFGDGTGRRGDRHNGFVFAREICPV